MNKKLYHIYFKEKGTHFYYGDLTPEEFAAMQKAAEEEGQSYD